MKKADHRYVIFRTLQLLCNFVPAILWVTLALHDALTRADGYDFIPLLISGSLYLAVVSKVVFYGLNPKVVLVSMKQRQRVPEKAVAS